MNFIDSKECVAFRRTQSENPETEHKPVFERGSKLIPIPLNKAQNEELLASQDYPSSSEEDSSFILELDPETIRIKDITDNLTTALQGNLLRYKKACKEYSDQNESLKIKAGNYKNTYLNLLSSIDDFKIQTSKIKQNISQLVETANSRSTKNFTEESVKTPSLNEGHITDMLHDMKYELDILRNKCKLNSSKQEFSLIQSDANRKDEGSSFFHDEKKTPTCTCVIY